MKHNQILLHHTRTFPFARRTCLYNPSKVIQSKWLSQRSEDAHGHVTEERAPSIAEEFKRVAEEKANVGGAAAEQSGASQATDGEKDGAEEKGLGDGDVKYVKKRVVENEPSSDYRTRE